MSEASKLAISIFSEHCEDFEEKAKKVNKQLEILNSLSHNEIVSSCLYNLDT